MHHQNWQRMAFILIIHTLKQLDLNTKQQEDNSTISKSKRKKITLLYLSSKRCKVFEIDHAEDNNFSTKSTFSNIQTFNNNM
jgi:hypothetical protein